MKEFNLLYEYVKTIKVKVLQNKPIDIYINDSIINSSTLNILVGKLKYVKLYYKYFKKTIHLHLGKIVFADKITYLLLDLIIYDLLKNTNFKIHIDVDIDLKHIINQGIKSTAFVRSTDPESHILNPKLFIEIYEKKMSIANDYFRRYITRNSFDESIELPSVVITEISTFLKTAFDDEIWIDDVCDVMSELLDNIYSHTNSDCLIDIDICDANDSNDNLYKVLNIAVINFSENKIYDRIKNKILEREYSESDYLYRNIYKAYDYHKNQFSNKYNEDDFFQITAFQKGVTTRENHSGNSGKGLTTLIKKIVDKTHESYSYVLSGNNILCFEQEYLDINTDGFIGFNKDNNYISDTPAENIILKSDLYIPGTIFHLSLFRKSEDSYGK